MIVFSQPPTKASTSRWEVLSKARPLPKGSCQYFAHGEVVCAVGRVYAALGNLFLDIGEPTLRNELRERVVADDVQTGLHAFLIYNLEGVIPGLVVVPH